MPTAAEPAASGRWLTGGRIYPQIADRLRERIASGEFPPGSALPSEAALGRAFGVARNTVRRGLAILEDEGLLVTIPAKGRIVCGAAPAAPYRYLVIAETLREQIERGTLAAGAPIPSEAALRRRFAASRNTVRQALAVLEREGLVVAEHGRGRFVREQGEQRG
ncbi:DNA-binding GntR family transcriptional regulator [Thermocatellispora tengchongensis]|uniref:DNA-binding GntR family transcriptional regulator n=1 Tax=Thermocatellispora tengchongensis TaxID=1073253 RepID=A0A840NTD1_9ACTN|nr:GntR family transcriptional regulator [Thermocatellispora tengchongensis]MBB5130838.1 DNA-binding GntR family transcriptional regulator [Thermocatellispora tengchongensis]